MSEYPDRSPSAALVPEVFGGSFSRLLLFLSLILIPVAFLIAWRLPVTYPEGDFVMNVLDVAKTGHVSSTFTPDTYPYLAGMAYKSAGIRGFLLEQVTVFLLVAWSVLWLVWLLTRGAGAVLVSAVIICLHPDLLTSIPKVWDTGLTCLLLLAFAGLCVTALRKTSTGALLALAVVWGCGVSVRPNFALLLLPIVYLLLVVRDRAWIAKTAAVAALAFAVFLLTNRLAHGSFYIAQNGPYNFFAGANPYSQAALLRLFNAESSVPLALAAIHIHAGYLYDLGLRSTYTHQALAYISSRPLEWLWLCVIKLFTLLRANTKSHAMFTPAWLVQVLTTLCVPIWLVTLALARKLERADKLMLVITASYILPFLLTNSDPRFRPPLDMLVLCHAASLLVRRFTREYTQTMRAAEGIEAPTPAAAN